MNDIKFISDDVSQIETNIITIYEGITKRKLAPGDPVRLFLLSLAYIITQQRTLINYTGQQNLLRYCEDEFLEARGEDEGVPRLLPTLAITTFKLKLSQPQPGDYFIPQGIRGTADGKIFFATTVSATIPGGEQYIEVPAECTTAGTIGNGYLAGQINKIVDPYPFLESLVNITESQNGTDIEDEELYRERIRNKEETYSTAGPEDGYKYWAKVAVPSIIDVSIESPTPGGVIIYILNEKGELPSDEIIEAVMSKCNARNIRPLTDNVSVLEPEVVNYDIDLTYWINTEDETRITEIQAAVNQAIEDYVLWQKSRLGRDIDSSELIARVKQAGAKRVQVISPTYQKLSRKQVAHAQDTTISFGGLEDD